MVEIFILDLKPKNPLGIAMHDFFHHFVFVAQFGPLLEDALVGQAGVVAAKHDFVLEATTNIDIKVAWEVLWCPA